MGLEAIIIHSSKNAWGRVGKFFLNKSCRSRFNMSYSYFNLVVFLLTSLVSRHVDAAAATDSRVQIKDYDNKVCNNEPTCNLTTTIANLEASKLTFPWRDCMCDADCSEYEDCCQDSQYYKKPRHNIPPKTYYCSPEAKIYMVVSCLPDFADERIKANCAKALQPLETNNYALILPVTNVAKGITYANAYCALCNKDKDIVQWNYASRCGEPTKEALDHRRMEVKKESSTVSSGKNSTPASAPTSTSTLTSTSTSTSTSTPTPNHNNRLNINVHLNPGSFFGKKDTNNGGFDKTISIPTFGNLGTKLANKTIGSETGFFGVKTTGRRKRHSDLGSINYYIYSKNVNEIMKVAKYDPSVKEFVAEYDSKTLICKLGTKMPDTVSKAVRHCTPNVISECPHDEKANKVCQSYMKIVHDTSTKKSYRNVDCAVCNGVNPKNTTLKGCEMGTRTVGGSSLFLVQGTKNPSNEGCADDPAISAVIDC